MRLIIPANKHLTWFTIELQLLRGVLFATHWRSDFWLILWLLQLLYCEHRVILELHPIFMHFQTFFAQEIFTRQTSTTRRLLAVIWAFPDIRFVCSIQDVDHVSNEMAATNIGDFFVLLQREGWSTWWTLEFFDLLLGFGSSLAMFCDVFLQAMFAIRVKTRQGTWVLYTLKTNRTTQKAFHFIDRNTVGTSGGHR